ncbi:hypothetical protein NPIL_59841 [Nephila pilipes]|uniref:Uncharacterized protein n=1 Tax=Nephila pilipes TaxID=299642 RepID=A0A8X6P3T8_NEPPI|nr:hypothetical protein NPIL_59841 [Nephila pilipes]
MGQLLEREIFLKKVAKNAVRSVDLFGVPSSFGLESPIRVEIENSTRNFMAISKCKKHLVKRKYFDKHTPVFDTPPGLAEEDGWRKHKCYLRNETGEPKWIMDFPSSKRQRVHSAKKQIRPKLPCGVMHTSSKSQRQCFPHFMAENSDELATTSHACDEITQRLEAD